MKVTVLENAPPPPPRSMSGNGESEYSSLYFKLAELKNAGEYVAITIDTTNMTPAAIDAARNSCVSSAKGWFQRQKAAKKFTGFRSLGSVSKQEPGVMSIWFILQA